VDALIAIWEEIDKPDQELDRKVEAPTCKHKFLKRRNANTQYKTKVKEGGEYCSKRKLVPLLFTFYIQGVLKLKK